MKLQNLTITNIIRIENTTDALREVFVKKEKADEKCDEITERIDEIGKKMERAWQK